MNRPVTLSLVAERQNLAAIRAFVREHAANWGIEPSVISDLLLAVDEAATNIWMHGYGEKSGPLELTVERDASDFIVRLCDQAPPFDPTRLPPPDLEAPLEERPIGGMGVHLLRQMMDQVSHRITPQGGNELTLIKRAVIPC